MLGRKGFTLVELLVVIIIVGILAAVSIPMMRGNLERARATEAVAALGAIRTQMRLVRAETGSYLDVPPRGAGAEDFTAGVDTAVIPNVPGFEADDLDGTVYSDASYTITVDAGGDTFTETAASVANLVDNDVTIDEAGGITGP